MLTHHDRSASGRFKTKSSWTLALAALLFLTISTGCSNCRSGDSQAMPTTSAARAEHLTSQLPANTEMAIFAPDLAQMQTTLNQANDRLEGVWPMVSLMQKQVQSELGINILSEQSWQQAGIATKGGFILASVQNRPVVLTYVDDRQAFEKMFIDRLKRTFNIEAPTRNEEQDGRQFKLAGTVPSQDIAWYYEGKLVVVAMPAFEFVEGMAGGTALNVASNISRTKKGESLNKNEDYQRFYKALGKDHPLSVFINTRTYLNSPGFAKAQNQLTAPFALLADWSKDKGQGLGIGFKTQDAQIRVQVLAMTDEKIRAEAKKAYDGAAKISWEHLATENTFAGLRLSVDFPAAWALYLENMPEQERQLMRRELKQIGASFDLDVEEDILMAISGNAALFFYGAHVPTLMRAMQGDPLDVLQGLGLVFSIQFKDTDKLEALLAKLTAAGQGLVGVRPLIGADKKPVDSIRVVELKNLQTTPGSLYIKGDTLTFASSALDENSVHQYLTGTRKEQSIKDVEVLDLGKRFATGDKVNGFYVNFVRARNNIGTAIPLPSVQQILGQLEELFIEGQITNEGFLATFTLDMTPVAKEATAQ